MIHFILTGRLDFNRGSDGRWSPRSYLSNHSLEAVLDHERNEDNVREESRELTAA